MALHLGPHLLTYLLLTYVLTHLPTYHQARVALLFGPLVAAGAAPEEAALQALQAAQAEAAAHAQRAAATAAAQRAGVAPLLPPPPATEGGEAGKAGKGAAAAPPLLRPPRPDGVRPVPWALALTADPAFALYWTLDPNPKLNPNPNSNLHPRP